MAGSRIEDALQNITTLVRSGHVGYATFWDGNKYIQCRRLPERDLRCEAAGVSMQPSLKNVLAGERLSRLSLFGWVLDPSFGNYVQKFPADMPGSRVAEHILRTLTYVYGADASNLEIQTSWIADVPCPPRNGPTQNLAGLVNDSASMETTSVRACSYTPTLDTPQIVTSASELIALYGTTLAAEIQRLRINSTRDVYTIFEAGIGYVQCAPENPTPVLYCEAQSEESWPALTAVITPARVSWLRSIGYTDPGRAPNYWKSYPFDKFSDADIASEILTILHEVYGYRGTAKLNIKAR